MDLIMKDYVSIPRAEILSRDQTLTAKDATISEQEKRIAELEAERDEARNRNASVELEADLSLLDM